MSTPCSSTADHQEVMDGEAVVDSFEFGVVENNRVAIEYRLTGCVSFKNFFFFLNCHFHFLAVIYTAVGIGCHRWPEAIAGFSLGDHCVYHKQADPARKIGIGPGRRYAVVQ